VKHLLETGGNLMGRVGSWPEPEGRGTSGIAVPERLAVEDESTRVVESMWYLVVLEYESELRDCQMNLDPEERGGRYLNRSFLAGGDATRRGQEGKVAGQGLSQDAVLMQCSGN
jgi:hypothetical protein